MAGSGGYAITISAVDTASKTIDGLNKRLAALSAPAERFNKSLTKFGEVSGLSRVSEGLKELGRTAADSFRSLDRMASPLAAMTGAASIAGVIELSKRWGEFGTRLEHVAYRINMPVERLSSLRGAARLVGIEASSLDQGMRGLQDTLSGAAFGRNPEAVQMFNALHVAFKDVNGDARRASGVLGDVADAIHGLKPETQARVLNTLGIGEDMLPLLKNGSKGLEDLRKQAERTGGGMTHQMVENAEKMNKAWNELGLAVEGVGNRIADSWSGTVTKVLENSSHWIERNQKLSDSIAEIGTAVAAIVALKPAAWVLRLLGLGGLVTTAETVVPLASPLLLRGDTPTETGRPEDNFWHNLLGQNGSIATWLRRQFGGPSGSSRPTLSSLGSQERAREAHDYYRSKGWSETQVAGILGYFGEETGGTLDPHAFNPDGGGRGAMGAGQWRGPRIDRFAAMHGGRTPIQGTWQEQYEFLEWELENTEQGPGAALRRSGTLPEAADAMRTFGRGPEDQQGAIQSNILRHGAAFQEQLARPDQGHVQVDVHLHGAPPGTTARVTSSGPVTAPPPRVETAMPGVM